MRAVFQRGVDHLRILTDTDGEGNVETIQTTDEHPFWVQGLGWVSAGGLEVGMVLGDVDGTGGQTLTVLDSRREEHAGGIAVYNFEVEGDHTYFVEDGLGEADWAWVHNRCNRELRRALNLVPGAPGEAAHIVPASTWANSQRSASVKQSIQDAQAVLSRSRISRDSVYNGFEALGRRHGGTHTNTYLIQLGSRLMRTEQIGGASRVLAELDILKSEIARGLRLPVPDGRGRS